MACKLWWYEVPLGTKVPSRQCTCATADGTKPKTTANSRTRAKRAWVRVITSSSIASMCALGAGIQRNRVQGLNKEFIFLREQPTCPPLINKVAQPPLGSGVRINRNCLL